MLLSQMMNHLWILLDLLYAHAYFPADLLSFDVYKWSKLAKFSYAQVILPFNPPIFFTFPVKCPLLMKSWKFVTLVRHYQCLVITVKLGLGSKNEQKACLLKCLLWCEGNGFCKCAVLVHSSAWKLETLCLWLSLHWKSFQVQDDCLVLFEMMALYFFLCHTSGFGIQALAGPLCCSQCWPSQSHAFETQLCAAHQSLVFRVSRCLYRHYVVLVGGIEVILAERSVYLHARLCSLPNRLAGC